MRNECVLKLIQICMKFFNVNSGTFSKIILSSNIILGITEKYHWTMINSNIRPIVLLVSGVYWANPLDVTQRPRSLSLRRARSHHNFRLRLFIEQF